MAVATATSGTVDVSAANVVGATGNVTLSGGQAGQVVYVVNTTSGNIYVNGSTTPIASGKSSAFVNVGGNWYPLF